jgi:hypothetical protein
MPTFFILEEAFDAAGERPLLDEREHEGERAAGRSGVTCPGLRSSLLSFSCFAQIGQNRDRAERTSRIGSVSAVAGRARRAEAVNAGSSGTGAKLDTLDREFDELLARMQSVTVRRAMKTAFSASRNSWERLPISGAIPSPARRPPARSS